MVLVENTSLVYRNEFLHLILNELKDSFFVAYVRCIVYFKLKTAEKPCIYKNFIIFFGFPGNVVFFTFNPSDIWVYRFQKLDGCVFFG